MNLRLLATLLAVATGLSAPAPARAELETVSDVSEGIAIAREYKRLIIFVLGPSFDDRTEAVQGVIREELVLRHSEFVVVHCNSASSEHRQLFTERFKLPISALPAAVVTDAQGNLIQSANGSEREDYGEMIQKARIRTGLETDPAKVAELGIDSSEMGYLNEDGVFAMRRSDVGSRKLALTQMRTWRFKNGGSLKAALLEAKDAIGVFLKPDGSTTEARFDALSDNDIDFIRQALVAGQAITD